MKGTIIKEEIASKQFNIGQHSVSGEPVLLKIESWYNTNTERFNKYVKVKFEDKEGKNVEKAMFHEDQKEKLEEYLRTHSTRSYAEDMMKFVREHTPNKFVDQIQTRKATQA